MASGKCPDCHGEGGIRDRECRKCGGRGTIEADTSSAIAWKGIVFMADEARTGLRAGDMVLVEPFTVKPRGVSEWTESLTGWLDAVGQQIKVWCGFTWVNPMRWNRVAFVDYEFVMLRMEPDGIVRRETFDPPGYFNGQISVDGFGFEPLTDNIFTTPGPTRHETVSAAGIIIPARTCPSALKSREEPHTRHVLAVGPLVKGLAPGDKILVASAEPDCRTEQYEIIDADQVIATIHELTEP